MYGDETVAHNVDVVDPEIALFAILVKFHILRSSSLDRVGHRVGGGTSVDDEVRRGRAVNHDGNFSIRFLIGCAGD